jgi:hypothetical protein
MMEEQQKLLVVTYINDKSKGVCLGHSRRWAAGTNTFGIYQTREKKEWEQISS